MSESRRSWSPRHMAPGFFLGLALVWAGCSGGTEQGAQSDSGGNQMSSGQSGNQSGSMQVPPPPPGTGQGEQGLAWEAPDSWTEETPKSSMRRAQFKVPGAGGDAELVVFYFGPGQGGDPMSNATRWAGQFRKPDGSSVTDQLVTNEAEYNGMKTLLVEVEGTYTNTMVSKDSFEGYMLRGAIVEGPDANWFFKMTGPRDTIVENMDEFDAFLSSLKAGA